MKKISFKLYRQYGALNSPEIFNAFEKSIIDSGNTIVDQNEDVPVIWSVLWQGRMRGNRQIYNDALAKRKPVIIIEVGNLIRNVTWRVSLNHVNSQGYFGDDIDATRSNILGVSLKPMMVQRRPEILIAMQRRDSLQWQGQPDPSIWIKNIVSEIRKYSSRDVIVRPHPRCPIREHILGIVFEKPKILTGSYDSYDINYNFHCVINHNSGPAVQAALNGVPIICDPSSLAWDVSDRISNIETIKLPDRGAWFERLCNTEWTVKEISDGLPLNRLLPEIRNKIS